MNKINKLADKINLDKKYPGYFNKLIFRLGFVVILFLFTITMYIEDFDFSNKIYVTCNSKLPCANTFYDCKHKLFVVSNCEYINSLNCPHNLCNIKQIMPGQTIGDKPSFLYRNFFAFTITIIFATFAINHNLYFYRRKNGNKN